MGDGCLSTGRVLVCCVAPHTARPYSIFSVRDFSLPIIQQNNVSKRKIEIVESVDHLSFSLSRDRRYILPFTIMVSTASVELANRRTTKTKLAERLLLRR